MAVVFDCFAEVNKVPRPSKREEKMIAFLKEFGESLGLPTVVDEVGNVSISKPATPGHENAKTVILQSHFDMVCEKNKDVEFDFDNDPIETYVDGEWLRAKGTTLGADDGIGVAMQMAIRRPEDIRDLKAVLAKYGKPNIPVFAKIENPEGVRKIEGIISAADGVMVARGDLGDEIPPEQVPLVQRRIIHLCRRYGKPVITATQM